MEHEYITVTEAAKIASYRYPGTLHAAARTGKLRTIVIAGAMRVTTRAWLEEYLASVKARGVRRGQPKTGATDGC